MLALCMVTASCAHPPKHADTTVYAECDDASEYAGLSDSQCKFISAPLDYGNGDNEMISLFVRKFPTQKPSRGSVLLLAGGPGESGASYYADIDFFRDVFADFDLIVPDHRGTGYSTKLCEPEETQASEGGIDLVGEEWGSCFGQLYSNVARAHAFNLDNASKDVALLIEALSLQGDVYLYGVSYGTELAIAVAERTDVELAGIMLDSLTPLPGDDQNDLGHRSQVTDRVGQAVLARCATSPSCPLGENAAEIYAALLKRIDAGETVVGLDSVPNGDLRQFMGLMLDVPSARNRIPAIIAAMASDDETAADLIQKATETYEASLSPILAFKQASSSIPLTSIMSGSEFNARKDLTTEQVATEKSALSFTSSLPKHLATGGFPQYEPADPIKIRTTLPPMLVLHGTLDPKTVYEATSRRVDVLGATNDITMLTLKDAPHVAYFTGKDCIAKPLRDFTQGLPMKQSKDCAPREARLDW